MNNAVLSINSIVNFRNSTATSKRTKHSNLNSLPNLITESGEVIRKRIYLWAAFIHFSIHRYIILIINIIIISH